MMIIPLFIGFMHPRWCRISSLNSINSVVLGNGPSPVFICRTRLHENSKVYRYIHGYARISPISSNGSKDKVPSQIKYPPRYTPKNQQQNWTNKIPYHTMYGIFTYILLIFSMVFHVGKYTGTGYRPNRMCQDYLEQLLSFGLSSLVFTFLDQTEILPEVAESS